MKISVYCAFIVLLSACGLNNGVTLIFPAKSHRQVQWSADERARDVAVRNLYRSEDASTHLIRLKGDESPHIHDHHDLNVSILSGASTIHFEDHAVPLRPGDVIFIPRGTLHWAENRDAGASIVFAVFSPAFDGKDRRKVE